MLRISIRPYNCEMSKALLFNHTVGTKVDTTHEITNMNYIHTSSKMQEGLNSCLFLNLSHPQLYILVLNIKSEIVQMKNTISINY